MARKAETKKIRPALTPEARENQMIALAIDLAEQKLLDGTANSQIITHYLKLASSTEKRRIEKLEHENELLKAKTEALQSAQRVEELYSKALNAMRSYAGLEAEEGDKNYEDF